MPLTNVFAVAPSWDLFTIPPDNEPTVLPAPQSEPGILRPFNIPPELYNNLLSVYYPLTISLVYATIVLYVNRLNKSRGNKPWAISRTGAFTLFVLFHNTFLTIYSAWTFVGMLRTVTRVFSGTLQDWDTYGAAPLVDALCKLSGPRGIGQAATWDPLNGRWSVKNMAVELLNGKPDPTDVGRMWNEGLAYYGWLFYLSKWYEVVDTFIILAKGKRSSSLQTYHHAGAMFCLWAGIRYMSPPIWLFVQFNSGVHTLMYFYYTLAAIGVKVPNRIKRSLTTMQISQFLVGVSFAFSHLIVAYQIPAKTPYIFSHGVKSAITSAASSVSSALPEATSSIVSAVSSAGLGAYLKKIALRAAGNEGLAENVRDASGNRFGIDALKADDVQHAREEIRYSMEYPAVHCIDTTGQAAAIWINVLYLVPLTFLFGRFFYKSYIKRAQHEKERPMHQRLVRSGSDAAKGVDKEIRHAMGDKQGLSPLDDDFAIEWDAEIEKVKSQIKDGAKAIKSEAEWLKQQAQEKYDEAKPKLQEAKDKARENVMSIADQAQQKGKDIKDEVADKFPDNTQDAVNAAKDTAAKTASQARDALSTAASNVQEQGATFADKVKQNAPEAISQTKEKAEKATQKPADGVSQAVDEAQEKGANAADTARENVPKAAEQAKETAGQAGKQAQEKTGQSGERAKNQALETGDALKEKAGNAANKALEKSDQTKETAKDKSKEAASGKDIEGAKNGRDSEDAQQRGNVQPKQEPLGDSHGDVEDAGANASDSVVDISKEDAQKAQEEAQNLEVSLDEAMSTEEKEAEKEVNAAAANDS